MQEVVVSATLHKTITICLLYLTSRETINETVLKKLIPQLSKPFILKVITICALVRKLKKKKSES